MRRQDGRQAHPKPESAGLLLRLHHVLQHPHDLSRKSHQKTPGGQGDEEIQGPKKAMETRMAYVLDKAPFSFFLELFLPMTGSPASLSD